MHIRHIHIICNTVSHISAFEFATHILDGMIVFKVVMVIDHPTHCCAQPIELARKERNFK